MNIRAEKLFTTTEIAELLRPDSVPAEADSWGAAQHGEATTQGDLNSVIITWSWDVDE